MRFIIVFPVPLDAWDRFRPWVIRFGETYRAHRPLVDHTVVAVCCKADADDDVRHIFRSIPVEFLRYDGNGTDSGAAQYVSKQSLPNDFLIGMTSRCYFHRDGWLERWSYARRRCGPGLYATCANRQGHPLHLCLRSYGMDCGIFSYWPYLIDRREMCYFFESGEGNQKGTNFTNWVQEQKMATKVVLFTGEFDQPDWIGQPGSFCYGDQSNMLVWDWRTDMYRDAGLIQKLRIKSWCWRTWPRRVVPFIQPTKAVPE